MSSNRLTKRVSHPDKGASDGVAPGEIIWVNWEGPLAPRCGYEELSKEEVDAILLASQIEEVGRTDDEEGPVEAPMPVPGSGILPSPDSFVARRVGGDVSFFEARSEIKEATKGAVSGRSFDALLENYAAWHMAVGQGLDG